MKNIHVPRKLLVAGALILLLLVTGVLAGCAASTTSALPLPVAPQQEGIWVTGTGKVMVVPDIATLSLGIESQETSVAAAQTKAADAMTKVVNVLKSSGLADKDIQTQFFNIQRVTRWDNDKQQEYVIGYRVTNIVTAKIRNISRVGAVIDATAQAGGDLTRVNSIAFSVEDPTKYYEELRTKAMTDAKSKAQQLAKLGEVNLGKPTFISESQPSPTPIYRLDVAAKGPVPAPEPAMPTPISAGETELVLYVQVVYSIPR